jgi:hypothetical protein
VTINVAVEYEEEGNVDCSYKEASI